MSKFQIGDRAITTDPDPFEVTITGLPGTSAMFGDHYRAEWSEACGLGAPYSGLFRPSDLSPIKPKAKATFVIVRLSGAGANTASPEAFYSRAAAEAQAVAIAECNPGIEYMVFQAISSAKATSKTTTSVSFKVLD